MTVFAIKIALRGISPMIWRRLHVLGSTSITDLHYTIQIAIGGDNELRAQFEAWYPGMKEGQNTSKADANLEMAA